MTPKQLLRHIEAIGMGPTWRAICLHYLVDPSDALLASRESNAVQARVAFCALLRSRGLSYPAIGRIVGRDHSSVWRLLQRHDASASMQPLTPPASRLRK